MFSCGIVFISSQHVYLLVKNLGLQGLAVTRHLSMIRNTDLTGRIYCVLELLCQIFFLSYSVRLDQVSHSENHIEEIKGLTLFAHLCFCAHASMGAPIT